MNSTLLMWTPLQRACWEGKLGFPPTAEHLQTWAQTIDKKLGLSAYLQNLSVVDLTPIWQDGSKHKDADATPDFSPAAAKLKSVWRAIMDFSPKPWHLVLFQQHLEKTLGIRSYFENVTIDELIEIVRAVAEKTGTAPQSVDSITSAPKTNSTKSKTQKPSAESSNEQE